MSKEKNNISQSNAKKGIYLFPNILTTAGLFFGFFSLVSATNNQISTACIAIFIAMIWDGLDGRVARLTGTQSEFGAQYDSMADVISFGIAPAMISYNWMLYSLGKIGWLAAFIFVAGAALRLARFNTQDSGDKNYFKGLPSPAAAGLIAAFAWVGHSYEFNNQYLSILIALVTSVSGLLMVSNFKYNSFKNFNIKHKFPFVSLLIVVFIFVVIATNPAITLCLLFSIYVLSGPFVTFKSIKKITIKDFVDD